MYNKQYYLFNSMKKNYIYSKKKKSNLLLRLFNTCII